MVTIFRWRLLERMGVCISGELVVRFLHENKLNSEIFNDFINKNVFLCQFKLRI